MRNRVCSLRLAGTAVAVVLLGAAPFARANVVFLDSTTFHSTVGNGVVENFDDFVISGSSASLQSSPVDPAVLDANTMVIGHGSGHIVAGVTFTSPGADSIQWLGPGYLDGMHASNEIKSSTGDLTIDFSAGVNGFGLNVRGWSGFGVDRQALISIFDANDNPLGSPSPFTLNLPDNGANAYIGWTNGLAGIGKVVISGIGFPVVGSPLIDDLEIVAFASHSPELPAGVLWVVLSGGVALVAYGRRMPRVLALLGTS